MDFLKTIGSFLSSLTPHSQYDQVSPLPSNTPSPTPNSSQKMQQELSNNGFYDAGNGVMQLDPNYQYTAPSKLTFNQPDLLHSIAAFMGQYKPYTAHGLSFYNRGGNSPRGSASPSPSAAPTQTAASWGDFVNTAKDIAAKEGFPLSVLLGQAALESGRGTSQFAKDRNNYFGYQAYDNNPNAAASFSTPAQGIQAYINLIKNDPRYAQAWNNRDNPVKMVQAIKQAGYASDPQYIQKVIGTPEFQQYLQGIKQ